MSDVDGGAVGSVQSVGLFVVNDTGVATVRGIDAAALLHVRLNRLLIYVVS